MKPHVILSGAIFCALLFQQCSEKAILSDEPDDISYRPIVPDSVVFDELFSALEHRTQSFIVNPKVDTVLSCRQGTKVFLPKDLLCFKDGSTPERRVKVIVDECYDAASFLSNNLTTSCGDRLLESGGSVNIAVSSEGKELFVKEGMDYEIAFPKEVGKDGMEIFYGQETDGEAVTWVKPTETSEGLNREKRKADTTEVPFNGKPVITTYTIPLHTNRFLKFIDSSGDTIDFRDYFADNFVPGKEFLEYSGSNEEWGLPICFGLDTVTGKLKDFLIRNSSFPKEARIELLTFLQKLPPMCVAIEGPYTGWTEGRKRWLNDGVLSKNARYEMEIELRDSLYDRRQDMKRLGYNEAQYTAYLQQQEAYNILYARRFGWINCDRFISRNVELANYAIPVSSGAGEVRLFFESERAAMIADVENGVASFKVPVGQKVKVLYMNFNSETPEYLVYNTNTSIAPTPIKEGKIYLRENWEADLKAIARDLASTGVW